MKKIPLGLRPMLLGGVALAFANPAFAQPRPRPAVEQKIQETAKQKLDDIHRLIRLDESQIGLGRVALQRSHDTRLRTVAQNLIDSHLQHLRELGTWLRLRARELRSEQSAGSAQGVGGSGMSQTTGAQQGNTTGRTGVSESQQMSSGDRMLAALAGTMEAYAQQADQHRGAISEKYAKLMKLSGNTFDRQWLDAVRETQRGGMELVNGGIERYASDPSFAILLNRTDQLLQENGRAAEALAPGLE